jgi:hypothetical protein
MSEQQYLAELIETAIECVRLEKELKAAERMDKNSVKAQKLRVTLDRLSQNAAQAQLPYEKAALALLATPQYIDAVYGDIPVDKRGGKR